MKRSCYCGSLREQDIDRTITAMGWVQSKRDMGGVVFIDLRDREGTLQVVFDAANLSAADFETASALKNESVISVHGTVRHRSEETYNPKIATGTVELKATELELLSEADPLPFPIEDTLNVREELRIKYRFLDLRRPSMLRNLRFRQKIAVAAQEYLNNEGFIEVETPILTKSTPEGARDYLVPSRVHPGSFYALPQSPQVFKQLLMVGGIDKYYQVARCFRDEDLRADRQPEFTQVDMEMSFIEQEDILEHLEKLFKHLFKEVMNSEINYTFPRLTWQEAMDSYGCDKPDLRFGLKITDISELAKSCSFSVFRSVIDKGGVVRAISVPGGASFTRSTIEDLTASAVSAGAKGMAWIAVKPDGELYSILTKYFKPEELNAIVKAVNAQPGDFILFCADKLETVRRVLCQLRLELGDMLGLRKKDDFQFLFVTDFPMFEWSDTEKRFMAMHHPFTMPYPEDLQYIKSDPARVRSQAYDVVLNGIELGSGSIRIHRRDVQQQMFEALGFTPEQISARFGFLVNAFRYGTPPHGGFAFGLDRLAMLLLGEDSLRQVIAFPKLKDASCPMTDAPDLVDRAQLDILGIGLLNEENDMPAATNGAAAKKRPAANIDVDNVANLSKLRIAPDDKAAIKDELSAIIAFADQLTELNTDGIEPTAHVIPMQNVLRADIAKPSYSPDALLHNAPTREDDYIFVPQVVE